MVKIKNSNLEIYGIIYVIKNKVNGKCYIGQTTKEKGFDGRYSYGGEGIERVYNYHKLNKEHNRNYNKHLLSSIEKYGFEAFEVDEEFDVAYSKEELDKLEDMYIKVYDCIDNGYNHKGGGVNGKHSEETKQNLREVNKGENNPMYGKHHTEESKQKMSEANKGENSPSAKKVICITTGKIFNTVKEAEEYYNLCERSHISKVCKGERKSCGKLPDGTKLMWKYYEDYLKEQQNNEKE